MREGEYDAKRTSQERRSDMFETVRDEVEKRRFRVKLVLFIAGGACGYALYEVAKHFLKM